MSILLLVLSFLSASCATNTSAVEPEAIVVSTTSTIDQEMLDRVNAIRAAGCRCGQKRMPPVPPLRWDTKLATAAANHAKYMDRSGRFDHRGAKRSTPADRVSDAGYNWKTVAENIAMGQPTVASVMESWKNSPGHCVNMMGAEYSQIGAARQGAYWVQVFAHPR